MKYRLKKDLPFAKADAELWVDNCYDIWIMGRVHTPTTRTEMMNNYIYLGKASQLISEGWIEEVKPREFYVAFDINGMPMYAFFNKRNNRCIKVREVIE